MNHWRYLGLTAKAAYQRNMLIGMLTAVVLGLVSAVLLETDLPFVQSESESAVASPERSGGNGPATWAAGLLPDDAPRSGFLGFIRVTPVSGRVSPAPSPFSTSMAARLSPVDLNPTAFGASQWVGVGNGTGDGIGNGNGTDDGFGLPPLPLFALPLPVWRATDDSVQAGISRPATAELYPPRFPPEARRSDTGIVVMSLTIHKDATIAWRVLEESPAGFGFAREVLQALKYSRFSPRRVRGEPVEVTMTYRCVVCLRCPVTVTVNSDEIAAMTRRSSF